MKHFTTFYLLLGMTFFSYGQNTCATALPISAGIHVVTAVDGTEIPTTACATSGLNNVTAAEWYTYTATNDYTINLTTDLPATAGVDTRLHVYTGTCGALACHAGDDDAGSGLTSTVMFNVAAGQTYYIVFDNRWSSTGFSFELTEHPLIVPIPAPVTFTGYTFPTVSGTYGLAVTDMNGDFLDDIVTVSASSIQILYQQTFGAFITTTIPTTTITFEPTWSLAIGDIDKNGFNDILYGSGTGVTFMMANATGTAYTEISGAEYVFSQRSNFVDINNDGHLDAFVCHDVDPNVYYLNDGNGNLIFHQGGIGDHPEGGNYGSIWTDYDNDGDQDLFIAKCRGGASTAKINELHRNDGNGVFTNVSTASNMADPIQTWSAAWNDYNNDGWMDALVGASSIDDGTHKLMKNNGDGTFSNVTAGSGWDINLSLNVEHVSYDFDNDGFADVLGGGNKIMFNNGNMTFSPSPYAFSSGSIGDLNNDGFLDVRNGNTIYMNNRNENNWTKIQLQGIQSNSNGIGARVEIYGSWGKQIRDVRSGEGFKYMNTMNVHFGLGTADKIDSMFIKWPSGHIDQLTNPAINQPLTVVEGAHPLSLVNIDGKKIVLYPVPAKDFIRIENLDLLDMTKIQVYSQLGSVVFETEKKNAQLEISSLSEGKYFVVIHTASGEKYSESFIKY